MKHSTSRTLSATLAIVALVCVATPLLHTQPLRLTIQSIDARALPQIRLKVSVTRNGGAPAKPGSIVFSLSDNGRMMQLAADCPDSAVSNSVALVLDNSGTMSGLAFDSVKMGSIAVVDSLRANDAAAVYDFANGGRRVIDFTTDKQALRDTINALRVGANTPLYRTTDLALDDLAKRPGRKYCIVFTDGIDNASPVTWQQVAAKATAAGVRIYSIGFGNTQLSDDALDAFARQTGGVYYRVFSPVQIAAVLRGIVSEIVSPYCTLIYDANSCTDSLHFLHVEAVLDGEHASADTVFAGPFRRDTLVARVVAPARIAPGQNAVTYIALSGPVHTGLQLSFHFLLRYDPALLGLTSMNAITVGTVTQNGAVFVRKLREGVLDFRADFVQPGMAGGNLVGVAFKGLAAGVSRPVVLSIDSLTFSAGCPNSIITIPDTIDVCQCVKTAEFTPADSVIAGAGQYVDVHFDGWRGGKDSVMLRFNARWDTSALRWLGYDYMHAWMDGDPSSGSIRLVYPYWGPPFIDIFRNDMVQFTALPRPSATRTVILFREVTMYEDCCYDAPDDSTVVYIDGYCEKLVGRKAPAITQAWPNPARDELRVRLALDPEAQASRLELVAADGWTACTIPLSGNASEDYITIPVSNMPSGQYLLRLSSGGREDVRRVVVVR
ncbi:MAG: VWA domain-containing protein [Ignavibacteria bacterium]|nr:VWA domain-containing protein [Ignavibacteria bacterium]